MAEKIQLSNRRRNAPRPYVPISRHFLWHPPADLSPFEIAIVVGLCDAAQHAWEDQLHAAGLKEGAERIAQENSSFDEFKQRWRETNTVRQRSQSKAYPAPTINHTFMRARYRPTKRPKALREAGHYGYIQGRKGLRAKPPLAIELTLSRYAILRAAGLSSDGDNLRRVDEVLDRLAETVVDPLPPLIASWRELRSGKFRIEVHTIWFTTAFGKVPKPLPLRSPPALRFYLFTCTSNTHETNRKTMRVEALCDLLGISKSYGAAWAIRRLDAAVDIVNRHLRILPAAELHKARAKVPKAFSIRPVFNSEHVRIVSIQYRQDAQGRRLFPRPKVKRERVDEASMRRWREARADELLTEEEHAFRDHSREIRANLAKRRADEVALEEPKQQLRQEEVDEGRRERQDLHREVQSLLGLR